MYFLLTEREMAWIFKFSIHSPAFVYSDDFFYLLIYFYSFLLNDILFVSYVLFKVIRSMKI